MPVGCRFAPRCMHAHTACSSAPPLHPIAPDHRVACVLHSGAASVASAGAAATSGGAA
jgi:peptide/nickel transport system ATP-binding protein